MEECGLRVSQKFIYHLGFCLAWKIKTNGSANQLHGEKKNYVACLKCTAFSVAPFLLARQHDRIPRLKSGNFIYYLHSCLLNQFPKASYFFRFCFVDQYVNYGCAMDKITLKKQKCKLCNFLLAHLSFQTFFHWTQQKKLWILGKWETGMLFKMFKPMCVWW